ncbi:MAG: NAD(P)H-hydrate dehydratase [Proteobacteria bacterium]|nr:NAD(P)H-hydrate dehydratase [Pseudomonadota bacterium]
MKSELLTSEEIKAGESATIAEGKSAEFLMERAAQGVVDVILKEFSPCPTLVFCGPGKNGGDAQVVARLLKKQGWLVQVVKLSEVPSLKEIESLVNQASLIVDGLFGTGLSRPLEEDVLKLVKLINASGKPIVAIDIPTGIDTNSGVCWGEAIRAHSTVTFWRARPGHFLLPGRIYVGKLFVKDIGIADQHLPMMAYHLNTPHLWKECLKGPLPSDHKYTRGACLIIGTGCMPGAVRLASLSARRVGAALVRLICKVEEYPIFAAVAWGDVVTPIASAEEFLGWIIDERFKALLWGAGAFPHQSTREQALVLLSSKKPCVLDGGALSSFEGKTGELTNHLHKNVILTPHEGEFHRLFPHLAFLKSKVEKALKAALEGGAVVVLKGHDTVIASPEGKVCINANAPATLATAGTGDVLAGLMSGLLAQGVPPFEAAAAAVWIHGEAANRMGIGLIAEDLPGQIPHVLQLMEIIN